MNQEQWAQEQLITIRSLMERASLYRAISSPTALFAGALTLVGSYLFNHGFSSLIPESPLSFYLFWFCLFLVISVFNIIYLGCENRRLGTPLLSRGMRSAVTDFLPSMLTGGILSFLAAYEGFEPMTMVFLWCVFYGLALLSTRNYAPRSLLILGWSFLLVGMILACLISFGLFNNPQSTRSGNLLMVLSFGLLHITYGASTWLTNRREVALRNAPIIEM
ncbi:MAG: hypothetical protein SGI98_07945 [Verrucomicrobiota bacterium]|nr:hypothetical protein [Verrucomicrobiota bacterium]